jgi:uncharacterized membrane protein YphA (DoxX/SURF4 family)
MSLTRRIARPLLAAIFVADGWKAVRNAAGDPPTETGPSVQTVGGMDSLTLVRVNGMVQIGGGIFLAVGKFPRLAALVLIGSIIPTTYTGQRFWEEADDVKRAEQRTQLLKNLGLLGGLILAAMDTEGAPSLSWRTRRRINRLTHTHAGSDHDVLHIASRASNVSHKAGRRAKRAAKHATSSANATAIGAARGANEAATKVAQTGAALASPYLRQVNEGAHDSAELAIDVAGPYITAGLDRAGDLIEEAIEFTGPYLSAGLEHAGELLNRVPDRLSGD